MQVDETAFSMFKEQLNSLGTHHDASLQKDLQNFCKKITQTSESQYMTEWLDEKHSRPLWQLGIIAMMSNKGVVMMVYGQSHEAELLSFEPPLDDTAADAPAKALLGATRTLVSDSLAPEALGTDANVLDDAYVTDDTDTTDATETTDATAHAQDAPSPSPTEIAPVAKSTALIVTQHSKAPDISETAAQSPYEPILAYEASAGSAFEAELASLSLT